MIPLWKGKNPIYVEIITIIPFDNLYRGAYFVMHTFLVCHCLSLDLRLLITFLVPFMWITQHYTKGLSTFLVDYTTLHQGTINLSCGLHNTTPRNPQTFLWITQHYTKGPSTFLVDYTTLHQGTINLSCGLHNTTSRDHQSSVYCLP